MNKKPKIMCEMQHKNFNDEDHAESFARRIPEKSNATKFVEKVYEYKAFKTNYKNDIRQLRYNASKEFRAQNKGWFLTLDIIGIILILFNLGALFMTGALVIKVDPTHSFVEANPAQCKWNGFACHDNAKDIILPFFKQAIIWALLIGAYIFTRNNTYNITGLWWMTAMMILYLSLLTLDFNNDLGLYVGKVIWGR